MKQIGIMGGTFDPVHLGHLKIGRQAYTEYGLDLIWYMPSKTPPHKKDHRITAEKDRVEMLNIALRDCSWAEVSDFELIRTGGNTYTADTLRLLREQMPDVEFSFIVGEDSIRDIEKWYKPEYVLRAVRILAAAREDETSPGDNGASLLPRINYLRDKYGARIDILHCPEFKASSADIREQIRRGEVQEDILPAGVYAYIREHGLYREDLQG